MPPTMVFLSFPAFVMNAKLSKVYVVCGSSPSETLGRRLT